MADLTHVSVRRIVQVPGDLGAELEEYMLKEEESDTEDKMTIMVNLSQRNILTGKRARKVSDYRHVDREAEWNRIKQQFPNSTTEKAKVSKKRKKPMRTEEGSAYSKAFTRVKGCLFSMRPEQAYLDAYEGGGWGGHSHNKIKPEAELRSARMKIRRAKGRIREVLKG